MNMEYEVRYYFPSEKKDEIVENLRKLDSLKEKERCYEKTVQYDHPSKEMSFYTKEIDGRFRIRVTKSSTNEKCMISWKRRLPTTTKDKINQEEEVELNIRYEEYENLLFLIEQVLKMRKVESYERYRTNFQNEEIEVSVDEYPFGIALEIENKSRSLSPQETVQKWVELLGLNLNDAYRLSWDDKYSELCQEQGVQQYHHVTFDLPMPKVK